MTKSTFVYQFNLNFHPLDLKKYANLLSNRKIEKLIGKLSQKHLRLNRKQFKTDYKQILKFDKIELTFEPEGRYVQDKLTVYFLSKDNSTITTKIVDDINNECIEKIRQKFPKSLNLIPGVTRNKKQK